MGVQGLTTLLEQHARPQMVTKMASDPKRSGPNILLVDANNVEHYLVQLLQASTLAHASGADFHASLYHKACDFYAGIQQNSGLRCVLVLDGAWPPGHEELLAARARANGVEESQPPTVGLVFMQAYRDLGLEVISSIHSADELLLAWYHKNATQIFAVLTNDSDFFVYGVERITHFHGIVIDHGSVTFHIWNTNDCWRHWTQSLASRAGAMPPMAEDRVRTLRRRAQVAAVLGNDSGKSIRRRLAARRDQRRSVMGSFPSAPKAAKEVLLHPTGNLTLDFFKSEPLSIRAFDAEDLAAFNEQVKEYLDGDAAARAPSALDELSIGQAALPWLAPRLLHRLQSCVVPRALLAMVGRGVVKSQLPAPFWQALQPTLQAAAEKVQAPGPVYQYNVATNELYRLTVAPAASPAVPPSPCADWFDPAKHLPQVKVVDALPAAPPKVGATLDETLRGVRAAYPLLPETMAQFAAVLLHAVQVAEGQQDNAAGIEDDAVYASAVRQLLLPGMASAQALHQQRVAAATAQEAGEEEEAADTSAPAGQGQQAQQLVVVPVGTELSKRDWADIDAADVVAKARSSAGFHLMTKLQPYDASALAATLELPRHDLFIHFYAAADEDGVGRKIWGELLKACFPKEYAESKEGDKAAVKARHKEYMALAKTNTISNPRVKSWLDRLKAFCDTNGTGTAAASELLSLRRDAGQFGPQSMQWQAAKVCWSAASPTVKQQLLGDMWAWGAASATSLGLPPMRHAHQQELLDLVHTHLQEAEATLQRRNSPEPLPLQIIFSTPTGSGKTFSAVMMHLHLLRPRPGQQQYGQGHPETIVLYSVPTKQVLKKVGQDCEAHKVVYWTAAKDGDLFQGDLESLALGRDGTGIKLGVKTYTGKECCRAEVMQWVRRPYSIRSQRGTGATGAGSMKQQLEAAEENGRKLYDIGGGHPHFIVADVHSTAAILQAAAQASPDDFYHSSKLLLYFDEPTMGIHLDRGLQKTVRDIMRYAPLTTILASATMPAWDQLPAWWKGRGIPATRTVISLEPYSLPTSRLKVFNLTPDGTSGTATPINLLQLFPDAASLHQQIALRPRLGVLVLRHLAPTHANQLLLDLPKPMVDAAVADEEGWDAVEQDVASLRQAIGPQLQELDAAKFEQLREQWAEPGKKLDRGWADVISQKGVTMVATLDPRRLALEIAGKWRDPEGWDLAAKDIISRIKIAKEAQKQAARASQRTQKKTADDEPPSFAQASSGGVRLRKGLEVSVEQAEEAEEDLLVMLSKGVAFACTNDTDPLVMSLYQQALLWIPDRLSITPSINVLVVDYSSIYGTDCSAVDTIVMCKDLGEHLSWEDHQQFIGRLRRDGTAVYPSWSMLCYATTGVAPSPAATKRTLQAHVAQTLQELAALTPAAGATANGTGPDGVGAGPAPATSAEASKKLRELRRQLDPAGEVLTPADVAAAVLTAVLTSLVDPLRSTQPSAVQLYKEAVQRLQKWGGLKPVSLLLLKAPKDQMALVDALRDVCYPPPPAPAAVGAAGANAALAAAAAASGGAYPAIAPKLLQWLYEEDVLSEEAMTEWCKAQGTTTTANGANGSAAGAAGANAAAQGHSLFMAKVVKPFMTWLQEAEEDDEDEDEEDDE